MGPMCGKPKSVKDEGRILLIGLDGAGRVIVLRDKTYVPCFIAVIKYGYEFGNEYP